jgi:hypothetical protein
MLPREICKPGTTQRDGRDDQTTLFIPDLGYGKTKIEFDGIEKLDVGLRHQKPQHERMKTQI